MDLHFDNEEAATLLNYLRSGGWLEQVCVSMIQKRMDEDFEDTMMLVRRLATVMTSPKYVALMEWQREKAKAEK